MVVSRKSQRHPPPLRHRPSYETGGDWYKFFLDLGPLSNIDKLYYKGNIKFWNDFQTHPNFDEWWSKRR